MSTCQVVNALLWPLPMWVAGGCSWGAHCDPVCMNWKEGLYGAVGWQCLSKLSVKGPHRPCNVVCIIDCAGVAMPMACGLCTGGERGDPRVSYDTSLVVLSMRVAGDVCRLHICSGVQPQSLMTSQVVNTLPVWVAGGGCAGCTPAMLLSPRA